MSPLLAFRRLAWGFLVKETNDYSIRFKSSATT